MWWVLLPGAVILAAYVTRFIAGLGIEFGEQKATGLGAVAGGYGMTAAMVLGSWLLVSLALMNVWFFVAAGFAWRKHFRLQRGERWKLTGAVAVLMVIYSPILLVLIGQLVLVIHKLLV
jgi:hypothetical protein